MAQPEEQIRYYGYEDLVGYLRHYGADPLSVVLHQLEGLGGFESSGPFSVYWPTDTYLVAFDVSATVAGVIRQLLNDPRVRIDPPVPGGQVIVKIPEDTRMSSQPANPRSAAALRPYMQDRNFYIHLYSTEQSEPDFETLMSPPNTRYVWTG